MKAATIAILLLFASTADAGWFWCHMCHQWEYSPSPWVGAATRPIASRPAAKAHTPQSVVDRAIDLAELTPADLFYDLGCGDARTVKAAALRSGCRAIGIEIDPAMAQVARSNVRGLPVRIVTGDARRYKLHDATVVWMYLYPDVIEKLVPKVSGTARIIMSYLHPLPGLDAEEVMIHGKPVYIWRRSAPKRTTTWHWLNVPSRN